jgi:hypothetical protein
MVRLSHTHAHFYSYFILFYWPIARGESIKSACVARSNRDFGFMGSIYGYRCGALTVHVQQKNYRHWVGCLFYSSCTIFTDCESLPSVSVNCMSCHMTRSSFPRREKTLRPSVQAQFLEIEPLKSCIAPRGSSKRTGRQEEFRARLVRYFAPPSGGRS